jgi:hypothetical protein
MSKTLTVAALKRLPLSPNGAANIRATPARRCSDRTHNSINGDAAPDRPWQPANPAVFNDSFANENYSHYDGGQKSPSIDY